MNTSLTHSLEDLSHGGKEALAVDGGSDSRTRTDGSVGVVKVVKLVKALLHGVACKVVDDAEVDLTLDDAVLRVKYDLLNHISLGHTRHLLTK